MTNLYGLAVLTAAWLFICFFSTGNSRKLATFLYYIALMAFMASVINYFDLS